MSMISVCDGCGRQQPASCNQGQWFKPGSWYERTPLDDKGRQERTITACSRECIERAENKRAAEGHEPMTVVLPV
jgi:hypothetical protein